MARADAKKSIEVFWSIENFNFHWIKKKTISSSKFSFDESTQWKLELNTMESTDEICFVLTRLKGERHVIPMDFDASLLDSLTWEPIDKFYSMVTVCGQDYVTWRIPGTTARNEVFKGKFFPENSLSIRCRIWLQDSDIPENIIFRAHTWIRTQFASVSCLLREFGMYEGTLSNIDLSPDSPPNYKIELLPNKRIIASIYRNNLSKNIFAACKIYIMDGKEKVIYAFYDMEHFFQKQSECLHSWETPQHFDFYSIPQISEDASKNEELMICCDFSFSDGTEVSFIEEIKQEANSGAPSFPIVIPFSAIRNEVMTKIDNKQFDFIFRVGLKTVPAHKVVLRDNIPFFRTVQGRKLNSFITEDLGFNAVNQMMNFLYTNVIYDLEWGCAKKLLYASEKFQLKLLKDTSVHFLKKHICIENVFDALVFGYEYKIGILKAIAEDFVCDHYGEIEYSGYWEKFAQKNEDLMSELYRVVIMKRRFDDE